MASKSTQNRISLLIKAKRRESGFAVRKAASDCGISAATLSRLERGDFTSLPDAETLTKLATWGGISVSDLLQEDHAINPAGAPANTTPEIIEVHLRADKNLNPETAEALANMFKALYQQMTIK